MIKKTHLQKREKKKMSSSPSMSDLLPLPLVFSTLKCQQQEQPTSRALKTTTTISAETVRLSIRSSARVLNGSLDFGAKEKRLHFIPEAVSVTREMEQLFCSSDAVSTSSSSSATTGIIPDLVEKNPDCVVVRLLFGSGFPSNSFSFSSFAGSAHSQNSDNDSNNNNQCVSTDLGRLASYALSPHQQQKQQQQQHQHTSSSRKKGTAHQPSSHSGGVTQEDLFFSGAAVSTTTAAGDDDDDGGDDDDQVRPRASSTTKKMSPPPGLSVVGKVVAAGKNVQFANEWMPEPGPTSIVPRGFKEGDLVAGLSLSHHSSPLSGSMSSYALIPACFLMRLSNDDFGLILGGGASSSSNPTHRQQQQPSVPTVASLLSSIAASLLPATLWYSMLRWHIDPRWDEEIAIVSVSSSVLSSPLLPASIGAAVIRAAMSSRGRGLMSCCACTILASTEEEAVLLENRLQQQQQQQQSAMTAVMAQSGGRGSSSVDENDDANSNSNRNPTAGHLPPLFRVSRMLIRQQNRSRLSGEEEQQQRLEQFHHVIVCDDVDLDDDDHFNQSDDADDEDDADDDPRLIMRIGNSTREVQSHHYIDDDNDDDDEDSAEVETVNCRGRFQVSSVLDKILRPGGTVAYLSTRLMMPSGDEGSTVRMKKKKGKRNNGNVMLASIVQQRIAASILPAVIKRSGRLAVLSTCSLFSQEMQVDHVRASVAEALAIILSGQQQCCSAPIIGGGGSSSSNQTTLFKVEQRVLEPLQKQFRQISAEYKRLVISSSSGGEQVDAQQQQQQSHQNVNATKRAELESRWCVVADGVGEAVEAMLKKAASAFISGRKQRQQQSRLMRGQTTSTPSPVVVQFPA